MLNIVLLGRFAQSVCLFFHQSPAERFLEGYLYTKTSTCSRDLTPKEFVYTFSLHYFLPASRKQLHGRYSRSGPKCMVLPKYTPTPLPNTACFSSSIWTHTAVPLLPTQLYHAPVIPYPTHLSDSNPTLPSHIKHSDFLWPPGSTVCRENSVSFPQFHFLGVIRQNLFHTAIWIKGLTKSAFWSPIPFCPTLH